MTTLADLKAAIADDIDDTAGEYASQIDAAISAAIRYCERYRFYFNETRDETFVTVDGREWYDAADNANIPTLVRIHALYRENANGERIDLIRAAPETLEWSNDGTFPKGTPSEWTYFNRKIRLFPIPGAEVFTIRMQLGPYRLAPLVGPDDSNAWLTEAYDMVKARAKYIVWKDTLKEPVLGAEALNDFNDQFDALKGETSSRTGTGFITPTCW